MSASNSTSGGFGGGSVLGAAVTGPVAAVVLPQTGILPHTGASQLGIMVVTAALTFAVMFLSRFTTRMMRRRYLRTAR